LTWSRADIVLDPFAGAGSTLVAAHRARRVGYGIEIDPIYVDTAVRRLEKFTKAPARHLARDRLVGGRSGDVHARRTRSPVR